MSAVDRISHLESCLIKVGLTISASGSLPALKDAKALGEKRALEKEMSEIAGAPLLASALKGGKRRASGDFEEEDDESAKNKKAPAKKFGAFLDQSDSSE